MLRVLSGLLRGKRERPPETAGEQVPPLDQPMPIPEFKRALRRLLPDPLLYFRLRRTEEIRAMIGPTENQESLLLVLSTAWTSYNSLRRVIINDAERHADFYFGVTSHRVFLAQRKYQETGVGRHVGVSRQEGWQRWSWKFGDISTVGVLKDGGLFLEARGESLILIGRGKGEQQALDAAARFIYSRRSVEWA